MAVQVILNNEFKLDTNDKFDLLLSYQTSDIRSIGSHNASFSKSISLDGTANNNQTFSNLFDATVTGGYNPNKKATVQVYSDGLLIFQGYLKIDSIVIDYERKISYQCTMYSSLGDLFTNLGQLQLDELDFSEYTHTYSTEAITGSWETYIYLNGQQSAFSLGQGYVYPYIDYGVSNT